MKLLNTSLTKQKNKKFLVIFPHPDDETAMSAGLIQTVLAAGHQVKVVIVTNGVLGQIHIHGLGRNVIQIRRQELYRAMHLLGVKDVEAWNYCDGTLKEQREWHNDVDTLFETYSPDYIVTYGPDGISGHPDHLALGSYIYKQWKKSESFTLLWPSFTDKNLERIAIKSKTANRIVEPTWKLKLSNRQIKGKIMALDAHQSQNLQSPIVWLENDSNEYFATPDSKTAYNYEYVSFDLGI